MNSIWLAVVVWVAACGAIAVGCWVSSSAWPLLALVLVPRQFDIKEVEQ